MARPNKEEILRKNTKEALILALKKSGNDAQYYLDQIEEYMKFYDNLTIINKELSKYKDEISDSDTYTKLLKEKRLVAKEMRNTDTNENQNKAKTNYQVLEKNKESFGPTFFD